MDVTDLDLRRLESIKYFADEKFNEFRKKLDRCYIIVTCFYDHKKKEIIWHVTLRDSGRFLLL